MVDQDKYVEWEEYGKWLKDVKYRERESQAGLAETNQSMKCV